MPLKKIGKKILTKTKTKRTIFFLLGDIIFIALSCWLAFLLRFDGYIPVRYFSILEGFIAIAIPLTVFFFWIEGLYLISWSFVSISELLKLVRATIISFLAIGATLFILRGHPFFEGFPRSIIFISTFLVILFTGTLRFAKRFYLHGTKRSLPRQGRRVLIVGAGEAGEQLIRHMIASKNTPYFPIGLIDDNPMKQGVLIHGVRVLGKRKNIPGIIEKENIEEMIIAMPSAEQNVIR